MKILIIGPRFHPNQTLIVKTLIDNGHNVFFRSLYKGKFEDYRYIKPKILKGLLFFNRIYFPNPVDVYKTFLQIKPKIIILRQYSRILTYLVTLLSVRFKTKIFIYEQAPSDLSHLKKKKIKFLFKKIEIFFLNKIFNTIWFTPLFNKKLLYSCMYYLPFIVNMKKIKKIKSNFRILIIARFEERKKILFSLKVLNRLSKNYKFNLTVIGEVSKNIHIQNFKKCKNFINLNNLNKKFTLLRNIEHKKIFNFYKTHHLFVLPSIQEPASISVLEAIGYSMPVVCSDTNGTKSYLNNTFSKVFKSNNSLSLYKSIEYFLKNNQEYNKFSLKAYNSAYKNLSKKNYMKKFNAILKAEKIEYK